MDSQVSLYKQKALKSKRLLDSAVNVKIKYEQILMSLLEIDTVKNHALEAIQAANRTLTVDSAQSSECKSSMAPSEMMRSTRNDMMSPQSHSTVMSTGGFRRTIKLPEKLDRPPSDELAKSKGL